MTWMNCEGWWEQPGFGRQTMSDLRLQYANGLVEGRGKDVVGAFQIHGSVNATTASLIKQYDDAHEVTYHGMRDGEGAFFGRWSIFGLGGKWLIKIRSTEGQSSRIHDL